MPALQLVVTSLGYAALVNAQHNGTLPITIASVGVTSTAFTPSAGLAAVPNEIKRLVSIAGGATAADTLHVTIRDNGADTYSLRGLGLYLQDGTLFAAYSQATTIVEKSDQATMLLAVDVQFTNVDSTQLVFGDTNFQLNVATTEAVGVIEVATDDESVTGTDPQRAVSPKGLKAALDARLGAGAPSGFVKGLLTAASALALRIALGIKSAATYDSGADNGLDADLLDGQHGAYYRQWANLQGVPASFPPSAHQHSAADITSGTLTVARGGTGAGSFPAGNFLVGAGTGAIGSRTPAQVLGDIGAAASVHTHAIADVNGLQAALDTKAPLSSPALSGSPTAPTPASTDNSARLATTAYVQAKIAEIINGSPGALDTLKELADAMGDDPNFAATVTNALAQRAMDSAVVHKTGAESISGPKTFLDLVVIVGDNKANIRGGADARWTFMDSGGVRRGMLISTYPTASTGEMSLIAYTSDGGTELGSLKVGSNGLVFSNGSGTAKSTHLTYSTEVRWGSSLDGWYFFQNQNNAGFYNGSDGTYCIRFAKATKQVSCFGGLDVAGAVVAAGGFQLSDRRLKANIRRRPVQRGLARALAKRFKEWDRRADGRHDVGLIAQEVEKVAPAYVHIGDDRRRMRSIDKAGLALESSLDLALQLDEQAKTIEQLTRRLAALEKRA